MSLPFAASSANVRSLTRLPLLLPLPRETPFAVPEADAAALHAKRIKNKRSMNRQQQEQGAPTVRSSACLRECVCVCECECDVRKAYIDTLRLFGPSP